MVCRSNPDVKIFISIFIIFVVYIVPPTVGDACKTSLCRCRYETAECIGLNLTYIPRFPENIRRIIFQNNSLPTIHDSTFKNVSKLDLKKLELTYNGILHIDAHSFQHARRLVSLDLSGNNLNESSLHSLFTENTKLLKAVKLQRNGIRQIPGDIFRNFSSSNLETLDLSWNDITEFNFSSIVKATRLKSLFLRENSIRSVVLDKFPYLTEISLVRNNLDTLPDFCADRNRFPRLTVIELTINFIETYHPSYLNCLKHLTKLDLSQNAIKVLETDYFHFLPALRWISITNQRPRGMPYLTMKARVFNNSQLRTILFSENMVPTKALSSRLFHGCDNLELLDLSLNLFTKNGDILESVLSDVPSLRFLILHDTRLTFIPMVVRKKLHNLRYLDISRNDIVTWPSDFFYLNVHLTDLNLRYNKIRSVNRHMFPSYLRQRLTKVTMRGNPFLCDCDLVWFAEWVRSAKTKFKDYKDFRCLNITERICLQNTQAFISVTAVSCIFVLVLILVSNVYKYRWSIKYFIYMWRYRPQQLLDVNEKNFTYDVFVSYCVSDSDWVFSGLIPTLEQREKMKLCIHERDFEGGRLIIDNIIHHMESSRKCLVVLSDEFAQSDWCKYEVDLAQRLVMDMCIQSLVIVLLDDISTEHMSRSLHALLATTTYIYWNVEEEEETVLWERLNRSLRITEVGNEV